MARTPLMRMLRRMVSEHHAALQQGVSVETIRQQNGMQRRDFLKLSAVAAAAAITPFGKPLFAGSRRPKIAIIGAGIAGLNAALTLQDAGIASSVYESDDHIGGRIQSITSQWQNGQVSEWCGEFIDSGHTTLQALAQRFGLALDDLLAAEPNNSTETYYFGGKYYSAKQANKDFQALVQILQDQNNAASYPTLYNSSTATGQYLDSISIYDWIEEYVPGGHSSKLGQLLDVAYDIEYGASTKLQSSLSIVYLLPGPTNNLNVFGYSDEQYHIRGGNQQVITAIANTLPANAINVSHKLTAISKLSNGKIQLTVSVTDATSAVSTQQASFDSVILTLPFSTLRNVDYSKAGFDQLKQTAITQLGYGTNAKVMLQFNERVWLDKGKWGHSNGTSYSDTGYQTAWDITRAQPSETGILVNYLGSKGLTITPDQGDEAFSTTSPAVRKYAAQFLKQIEPVFPGLSEEYTGLAALHSPKDVPNLLGSYSYWKVGQYTAFSGYEGVRQGNIHFAGEHCSTNFQGFMEGGAEEGARAAGEILADIQAGAFAKTNS